jgi:MoaA/NifB/PqqE/SkfB family radical SAM enzyme
MKPPLTLLWRGPLSGCNYDCGYCPFAKTKDSRATLAQDRAALARLQDWVVNRDGEVSILFTPWGEALIRKHYRDAMIALSHAPNVATVAVQTNLSCAVDWIADCDTRSVAFWATYHHGETPRAAFLAKIAALQAMGVRYSVGSVAAREHLAAIEALRRDLPPAAYLWVNAESSTRGTYTPDEVARLTAIDPLFALNNREYISAGRACAGGETVISVSGDGTARRCHFIESPIGNIYDVNFDSALKARVCPAAKCNCHIGYSHLRDLDLASVYSDGFLERRAAAPHQAEAALRMAAFDARNFSGQVSIAGL